MGPRAQEGESSSRAPGRNLPLLHPSRCIDWGEREGGSSHHELLRMRNEVPPSPQRKKEKCALPGASNSQTWTVRIVRALYLSQ